MRKDARRQELLKKKAEYEATQQSAEDTPAEAVSAEDMTVDGAPVPAEAPAETAEKNPTYKRGIPPFYFCPNL